MDSSQPTPEVLKPQSDDPKESSSEADAPAGDDKASADRKPATPPRKSRHAAYRPSHKATFIGLAVVILILGANVAIIIFIVKSQATPTTNTITGGDVTLSAEALDKLGVSRNTVGNVGTQLLVNPNAKFNGDLTVAHNVEIAGQLKLNSKFVATEAAIAKLDAGNTSLNQLTVNGDATATNLTLRKDMTIAGATRLQGPVTLSQLMTVNNSLNVAGNIAVGGTLSVRNLQVSSLTSDTTLTIGGHIITRGLSPSASPGSNLGSNGTMSISGSDAAGTIAVNIGAGGGSGVLAHVSFRQPYATTPHVVVTQIGAGGSGVYISRSSTGFSVGINGTIPPGGYAFDYIVMQ